MSKPKILPDNNTTYGAQYVKNFTFNNGNTVPVYNLTSTAAFNQMIGYAKFLNNSYGNVYYRGVTELYDNLLPAIMRSRRRGIADDINDIINKIKEDQYLKPSLQLLNPIDYIDYRSTKRKQQWERINRNNKYRIEGLLQHYAGTTRFLDVVDNHWIALWMGLHRFSSYGEGGKHIECNKRILTLNDLIEQHNDTSTGGPHPPVNDSLYEYVILIAMPYCDTQPLMGVSETEQFVEVDLRKALPSFYMRPHAQHALVVRKREKGEQSLLASYYDMASQVIGILRIRTDYADRWLGQGQLVTQQNLFPSPALDQGYQNLLKNKLFNDPRAPFQIRKYF